MRSARSRPRRTRAPGRGNGGSARPESRAGAAPPARRAATAAAAAPALAALLLAAPPGLRGQAAGADTAAADTTPEPLFEREPIRVTVTRSERDPRRIPFAVSVVDAQEAQAAERNLSLEESLESVPGVAVQNRRNHSLGDRLTVRGAGARAQFGVRGLRVLVDGVPLTMPDGQTSLTNLDLASAGRVEVVRGPASALYGNAAGGVIRVRTRRSARALVRAEPRVAAGSHGFLETRVGASGRLDGAGSARYVLSAGRTETDGFRRHARAEMYRANLVVRAPLGPETRLRAVANVYDRPFAQNPSSLDLEDARENPRKARAFIVQQGAGEEARQVQAGATLVHRPGGGSELEATAWAARRVIWNPIPTRIIDLARWAGGIRAEGRWRTRVAGLPARVTAGVDAEVQRDQRRETANRGVGEDDGRAREGELLLDQRERVASLGPFAQLSVDPSPRWRITTALRRDAHDFDADDHLLADGDDSGHRTLAQWSPSLGVSWTALPSLTLYASAGTAFETPTASELSNRPSGGGGFNPDLGPETLRTLEVGAKGGADGLRWQLTGYLSEVEDALVPREAATGEVFFRNAGRVDRRGLEAALTWRPVPRLRARLVYTLQDNTFERFVTPDGDHSGNREPGVPDHRLHAGALYRSPLGLRAEVDVRWVDDFPVNDANTARNWSYGVTDLRLRWEGPVPAGLSLTPFLGVDNLFDVRYNGSVVPNAFGDRYYEPAPGREWFGGLRLGIGG